MLSRQYSYRSLGLGFLTALVAISALSLSACGGGHSVAVNLRTDWTPGADYTAVRIVLTERLGSGHEEASFVGRSSDRELVLAGMPIAAFSDLAPGRWNLLVELSTPDGVVLLSRHVELDLSGDLQVTVVMARSCEDVLCSSGQACRGGTCVDPRCTLETPEFCGEAQCQGDDDCPRSDQACGNARCQEGTCLFATDDGACQEAQYCDPDRGCSDFPDLPDGGPPVGDAGPCSDVCSVGLSRCASAETSQTCALQPGGCLDWSPASACETDQVCAGEGICQPCSDGDRRCGSAGGVESCASGAWVHAESCALGCSAGACESSVSCSAGAYQCRGHNVQACNSSGTAWLHLRTCNVACESGLCTGACTPGETRCNGMAVETCDSAGTAWDVSETCTTFCGGGRCALDGLEIATDTTLDGDVLVAGAVIIRSGATVTVSSGELNLRADSVEIENGASLVVSSLGRAPWGHGSDGNDRCGYRTGGTGGGYGELGGLTAGCSFSPPGDIFGDDLDVTVSQGSWGGNTVAGGNTIGGGLGGGALRLMAGSITVAGTIEANGADGAYQSSGGLGGGGGSGGGILLAADVLRISGAISAHGGSGGGDLRTSRSAGADGGAGRVKLLYGSTIDTTGASLTGVETRTLMPPLEITSSTHPDSSHYYNDGFGVVAIGWNRPFAPLTGAGRRVGAEGGGRGLCDLRSNDHNHRRYQLGCKRESGAEIVFLLPTI